jgi:hypothetical protein
VLAPRPAPARRFQFDAGVVGDFVPRHAGLAALLDDAKIQLARLFGQFKLHHEFIEIRIRQHAAVPADFVQRFAVDDVDLPTGFGHRLGGNGAFGQRDGQAGGGLAVAAVADAKRQLLVTAGDAGCGIQSDVRLGRRRQHRQRQQDGSGLHCDPLFISGCTSAASPSPSDPE